MFNRKRIKELEAKLEAYKELTDQYQQALEAREQAVKRLRAWDSGVVRVTASYTITESDVNKYSTAYMPRVAKERMSGFIGRKVAKVLEPQEICDENGNVVSYEYDIEVRHTPVRENPYEEAWNEINNN